MIGPLAVYSTTAMTRFPCPHLAGDVELTPERWTHIRNGHPELVAESSDRLERTLADPDEIRSDPRFSGTRLFSRWFDDLLGGKIVVVAVVTEQGGSAQQTRHWVVTAYVARRITQGVIEWSRH